MLLINGEILNLNQKSAVSNQVKKYKKELEDIGYPIVFKFPQRLFKKLPTGETQSPCAKRLATKINFNGERGAEEIVYCRRYWNDSNENLVTFPKKILIDQVLVVQEYDWDLAVFLQYFYPNKEGNYYLYNAKAVEQRKHELALQETKVRSYIHNPKSVNFDDDKLRSIAAAYGIINPDNISLKNQLWDIVRKQEVKSNDGYANFLKLISNKELMNLKANVQKAIFLEIIKQFTDKASTWAYPNEEGDVGSAIIKYKTAETALEELFSHFQENEDEYKSLLNVMGDNVIDI